MTKTSELSNSKSTGGRNGNHRAPIAELVRPAWRQTRTSLAVTESASLLSPRGASVRLARGEYSVEIRPDGHLDLSLPGRERRVAVGAYVAWHEFNVLWPIPLAIPTKHGHQIVVLLPGGRALLSIQPGSPILGTVPKAPVTEMLLKWYPLGDRAKPPLADDLFRDLTTISVAIEPSKPTGFQLEGLPPDPWKQTTTIEADGDPDPVVRWDAPGSYVSLSDIRISSTVPLAGKSVVLTVTTNAPAGTDDIVWIDVYRIDATSNGPLTFPRVVVAGAHENGAPPAGSNWPAEVAKSFEAPPGQGAPVVFDVRLNGHTFPGSPKTFRFRTGTSGATLT